LIDTIQLLKTHNLLKIVDQKLDINLEIPHVAYIEVKKSNSKAILFTNPIDKANNKEFDTPVLMNIYSSIKALNLILGDDADNIANKIESLLKLKPPKTLGDKFDMFAKLFNLKSVFPKRLKTKGECQQIIKIGSEAKLSDLPVLTTWEQDGGPFITMGQVYTQSLNGDLNNLGMYRLQVYDNNRLGMHWQIHKDANHFFHEYKKAGKKMPVSIAIGGDPLYIWCGQAPMPYGMFELLLYGFIRKENAQLVKSITNDIYIPRDVDFVIEGFVDTTKMQIEGPFGDHTGYYTLKEEYPVMDITAITSKKEPIFSATVVGKPPLEDKYMGHGTGRVFLPLFRTTAPDVLDYHMPENGVFHNLILAKLDPKYPDHSTQLMHAFWGVGQMSFVKHAIFVGADAPLLSDWGAISKYILNKIEPDKILITRGVVDALDHSSPSFAKGGKLGIDATGLDVELGIEIISDDKLLKKIQKISSDITELKQHQIDTKNPIVVLKTKKTVSIKELQPKLTQLLDYMKIAIFVDDFKNDLDNEYMLVWRVTNNIDANRDIYIDNHLIVVDATTKNELDGYTREWPDDVECTPKVLEELKQKGVIDIDDDFVKKFML